MPQARARIIEFTLRCTDERVTRRYIASIPWGMINIETTLHATCSCKDILAIKCNGVVLGEASRGEIAREASESFDHRMMRIEFLEPIGDVLHVTAVKLDSLPSIECDCKCCH